MSKSSNLTSELYIGNTSVLVLAGLRNRTGDLQNDATVTLESIVSVDRPADVITGVTLPLSVPFTSNGIYEVQVPPLTGLMAGCKYRLEVKAVANDFTEATWYEFAIATYREA